MLTTKKTIQLEFSTPLQFVATYSQKRLAQEKESLEKHCGMSLLKIIERITTNDLDDLYNAFIEFSGEVGFEYCIEHNIFHEYSTCPLCLKEKL